MTDKTYVVLPGMKDRVGRTYSREQLEPFLGRDFYGHLGPSFGTAIDMANISHSVKNLRIEENGDVIGDLHVLETPTGKILQAMLDEDCAVHLSLSALGSVNKENMVEHFHLVCINVCAGTGETEKYDHTGGVR